MKRFLNVFATTVLLLTLSLSLCACDSDETSQNNPPPPSYGTATVNYHYQYDGLTETYWQEMYRVQTGKSYDLTELYTPPVKVGYRFLGWTKESGGEGEIVETPFSIVGSGHGGTVYELYAKYEAIPFEVVYHLDGGTNNAANPTSLSGKQTLKNPTKEKCEFVGWFRDPDFNVYTTTASMTDNATTTIDLYAKWRRIYEIKYVSDQPKVFVKGDQSGHRYTTFKEDDGELTVVLRPEYFKNYRFLGWECKAGEDYVESAEITINPKEVTQDLTFTAHYQEASNSLNTPGLRVRISYGKHFFYAKAEVTRIVVEDLYGDKQSDMTSEVTVYYSGETPPEVLCREGVQVTLEHNPEEVKKEFGE